MGEIADDMIEGFCCSLCGVYFEKEHGFPVLCKDCWNDASEEDKKHYSKAFEKELS